MLRKQKGFSLLELMVSMLIVSIALLGYAALQAYSTRALSGSYSRTSETAVLNDFVKLFQVSTRSVSTLNWPAETEQHISRIAFTCGNAPDQLLHRGETTTVNSVLGFGVSDICAQIEQSNKIVAHDIAFQLDRHHVPKTEIYSYRLRISFAYVPKKAGIRQDQTQDVESVTVAKYCPLNENEREKKYNQDRVSAGVVCSKVEVML